MRYHHAHRGRFILRAASQVTRAHCYEVLDPSTVGVLARLTTTADHAPALTFNKLGKGNALYLATESTPSAIGPVLTYFYKLATLRLIHAT